LEHSARLEAIGRLASGVAHDFNNLLTCILGYAEAIEEEIPDGTSVRDDLNEIIIAAQGAANLTADLLSFGRKRAGSSEVFVAKNLLKKNAKMIRRIIGEDIHCTLDCENSSGKIEADPRQVEQIIINLVANSRDAMPSGGDLTVSLWEKRMDSKSALEVELPVGDYICMRVQDSGEGIPEEIIEKIFEPFFTTKDIGKGSGLGLATVYGIVKQIGGNICVNSSNNGTAFTVYFPQIEESHCTNCSALE